MPDTWSKSFAYVWNVGSGIIDDKNSKISRLIFFLLAFVGIVFACFMFYRAEIPLNIQSKNAIKLQLPGIIDDKQAITNLQQQSENFMFAQTNAHALANSMQTMNRRLFTDDAPELIANLREQIGGSNNNPENNETIEINPNPLPEDSTPQITIKGLILAGKNNNRAVIDTNNKKGILVKNGSSIPEINAKVININSKGLKIRLDGKVIDYLFTR